MGKIRFAIIKQYIVYVAKGWLGFGVDGYINLVLNLLQRQVVAPLLPHQAPPVIGLGIKVQVLVGLPFLGASILLVKGGVEGLGTLGYKLAIGIHALDFGLLVDWVASRKGDLSLNPDLSSWLGPLQLLDAVRSEILLKY